MLRDVALLDDTTEDRDVSLVPPMTANEPITPVDVLDDVFGSAPGSPTLDSNDHEYTRQHSTSGHPSANTDPSDIPRLRSTHITNGYREGIADSKAKYVQEGFDEGYGLGAVIGLKAGWCLGVLEGVCRAIAAKPVSSERSTESDTDVRDLLLKAREDLKLQNLFGAEYFGSDGIWLYDVPGQDLETTEVTFRDVAAAHPLLKRWVVTVTERASTLHLKITPPFAKVEDGPVTKT